MKRLAKSEKHFVASLRQKKNETTQSLKTQTNINSKRLDIDKTRQQRVAAAGSCCRRDGLKDKGGCERKVVVAVMVWHLEASESDDT